MRKAESQLFLLKSLTFLLSYVILTPPPPFFFNFTTKFFSLCGPMLPGVLQTEPSKDLLISIHLPLLSNAFRCSRSLFKCILLIFTSEAHSSCPSWPGHLQPEGKTKHHSSPTVPPSPLCSHPFCTAGACFSCFNKHAAKDFYCLCTRWLTLLEILKYSCCLTFQTPGL